MTTIVPGLELDLGRRRLVHKPVELRNLSSTLRTTLDIHDDSEWIWEYKYDGCHMIVVKQEHGNVGAWSREGKPVLSVQHILDEVDALYPAGSVLFGEAYSQYHPFPEISGMFRRHSNSPDLHYVVFDKVRLDEFIAGFSHTPFLFRSAAIKHGVSYTGPAMSFVPSDRHRHDAAQGLDGFIAKKASAYWVAGDGKGGAQIKVKNHISLDLRLGQVLEGEGKFAGTAGALELWDSDGRYHTVSCGTMSNAERADCWQHSDGYYSRIAEVHALGYTETGALREPRFIRWRENGVEVD